MKVLAIPDTHCPASSRQLFEKAARVRDKLKPDRIIQLGDLIDAKAWSRFPKSSTDDSAALEWEKTEAQLEIFHHYFPEMTILQGNHCIEENTEVLTDGGWVLAKNLKETSKIASKCLETGGLSYNAPKDLWSFKEEGALCVTTDFSSELVSENHSIVVDNKKCKARDWVGKKLPLTSLAFGGNLISSFNSSIDLGMLEVAMWVITDGCMRQEADGVKTRLQWKLSKERKIKALQECLDRNGIKYTLKACKKQGVNKLQPYYIRVYGEYAREMFKFLGGVKTIPEPVVYGNRDVFSLVLKVLEQTDGGRSYNKIVGCTIDPVFVDRLQRLCVHHGVAMKIKEKPDESGFKNGKLQYHYTIADRGVWTRYGDVRRIGGCYTFVGITTKDGTLVTRRDGKAVVTGNCGRVMKKAVLDAGLPPKMVKSFDELLGYEGWDFYNKKTPLIIDGVAYIHGDETGGVTPLPQLAVRMGMSVMRGHSHQAGLIFSQFFNRRVFAAEAGALIDEEHNAFDYASKNPRRSFIGLGYVIDGEFPQLIPLR